MTTKNELLRALPKIDLLLTVPAVSEYIPFIGRPAVADICRSQVEHAKDRAENEGVIPDIAAVTQAVLHTLKGAKALLLGRVINGTGILLHTNLGRAPLGETLFQEAAVLAGAYCNLEIDVSERRRGVRGAGVSTLLRGLCAAEDAVVVNNNAAALFLTLSALAKDKEVIVSRGELVQIGGGFRIPDILRDAGAHLKEVGTTNITTISDYVNAITENSALVLTVHRANFAMSGFVESPAVRDLRAHIAKDLPIVTDLGSGNFVREIGALRVREPTPRDALADGADLVCFSCDKMLGASQGGVIAGKEPLIQRIKRHPIMRVVRPDKLTFAVLQTVLTHLVSGQIDRIPLWRMAGLSADFLKTRVEKFIRLHNLDPTVFQPGPCESAFGGGSTPEERIPSFGLRIVDRSADDVARRFQHREPPIVGRIVDDCFLLDFRTLLDTDEALLAAACLALKIDHT